MNLYYHYYAGIKWESLNACIKVFKYFREGNFAGVFASDYVKIVEDFYTTIIRKNGETYSIENNGDLRTVRIAAEVFPDLIKSQGVIGFLWKDGQTYIHVDGRKKCTLVLSDTKPDIPFLRQSTMKVGELNRRDDGLDLAFEGFGKGYFNLGGLKPHKSYTLSVIDRNEAQVLNRTLSADATGSLSLTAMFSAPSRSYHLRLVLK
jgi:hypothetical protein